MSSRNESKLGKAQSSGNITKRGGGNFKTISRDQYFETHVKNPSMIPPVGAYITRYEHLDPKVTCPVYGTEQTWGGSLAKRSRRIKDQDFKKKVRAC